jgi:hypothetical protein
MFIIFPLSFSPPHLLLLYYTGRYDVYFCITSLVVF